MAWFVSAVDGDRTVIVAGPWNTQGAALAHVEAVRRLFVDCDPSACWAAFGTCRHRTRRAGVVPARLARVNELIGYAPDRLP